MKPAAEKFPKINAPHDAARGDTAKSRIAHSFLGSVGWVIVYHSAQLASLVKRES